MFVVCSTVVAVRSLRHLIGEEGTSSATPGAGSPGQWANGPPDPSPPLFVIGGLVEKQRDGEIVEEIGVAVGAAAHPYDSSRSAGRQLRNISELHSNSLHARDRCHSQTDPTHYQRIYTLVIHCCHNAHV